MAAIALRNVDKRYADGTHAVKGVSLDIADGEFVVLAGPAGSGKSTLLRMVLGLEQISGGDVLIDGERVNDLAPRDRNLSMVFQNYALYPHLTVFDNIALPLRLTRDRHSDEEIAEKVTRAAHLLELRDHLDLRPGDLSADQRQRVAMGRAIVRDTEAFLFDEPLSNLSEHLRDQMRTEIARVQRRLGTTTIYVTSDPAEATTLGDRVAVLRDGVLQQVASPRELYEQPTNLFVAAYVGSPPMNLVPAHVDGERLRLPFADVPAGEDVVRRAGGRRLLIAGLRPEQFQDAAAVDPVTAQSGVTFEADVEVTQWRGDELYAHVPFEQDTAVRARLEELDEDIPGVAARGGLLVSLAATSPVREGGRARLWFDPRRMHLFDVETGERLPAT